MSRNRFVYDKEKKKFERAGEDTVVMSPRAEVPATAEPHSEPSGARRSSRREHRHHQRARGTHLRTKWRTLLYVLVSVFAAMVMGFLVIRMMQGAGLGDLFGPARGGKETEKPALFDELAP